MRHTSGKYFLTLPLDGSFVALSSNQSSQKAIRKAIKGPNEKVLCEDRSEPVLTHYPVYRSMVRLGGYLPCGECRKMSRSRTSVDGW